MYGVGFLGGEGGRSGGGGRVTVMSELDDVGVGADVDAGARDGAFCWC